MIRALAAALLLLASPAPAQDAPAETWPPGLESAATALLAAMRDGQERILRSTVDAPVGIEQVQQFDRGTHVCHTGPAQSVRGYGNPVVRPAIEDGRVPVRYPYTLRYRKAASLVDLFAKEWTGGTAGETNVVFRRAGDAWQVESTREVPQALDKRRSGW